MQNITHVLTTDQTELQGLPERQAAARRNIGVKVLDVQNSAHESLVDDDGIVTIPDGVAVDSAMSLDSTNPVQNKVITAAVNGKVDKVTGKGLSTNDYTNDEQTKLAGIEAGAEVNVQSDWGQSDETADDFIKNKPENLVQDPAYVHTDNNYTDAEKTKLGTVSEGANKVEASHTNGNIKIDNVETTVYTHPTTDAATAAAVKVGNDAEGHVVIGDPLVKGDVGLGNVDNTSDADKPISTATQTALDGKVDKVTGKGLSTNDYTTAEKEKLAGIEDNAQENVIETVKVDGTALTVTDKAVDIDLTGKEDKSNKTTSWGQELSDTKYPSEKLVKDSLDLKVDAEQGKGLSTNDFTDADKEKLDGISDEANKVTVPAQPDGTIEIDGVSATVYEHPSTTAHEAAAVKVGNDALGHVVLGSELTKGDVGLGNVDNTSDTDKPISAATQTALDLKVDKEAGKGLSTNDFTDAYKEKLDGVESGAQVNDIEHIQVNGSELTIDNKTVNIDLSGKADKVSPVTNGNFAGLDENGNLTDSGSKASDFATAAQGAKADTAIQGVKVNGGSEIVPDANKVVDIEVDSIVPPTNNGEWIWSDEKDASNSMGWRQIIRDYVGNIQRDDITGEPILDEEGHPITDEEDAADAVELWLRYKGIEFAARRAYDDETGENIHTAIYNRTTMAQVVEAIETALANYGGFKVVPLVNGVPDPSPDLPSEKFIYLTKEDPSAKTDPYTEWIWISGTPDGHWDCIGETSIDLTDYWHGTITMNGNGNVVTNVEVSSGRTVTVTKGKTVSDGANKVESSTTNGYIRIDGVETQVCDISGKADKVSGATNGNFAGLDANGNLTDSGSKAADFATAAQGDKADSAVQGVQKNGTDITLDANKKANVVVNDADFNVKLGSGSVTKVFSADAATPSTLNIPLAAADSSGATTEYTEGLMAGEDKEKLDGITDYVVSASVSGHTLTLTNKNGPATTFTDTGDTNVIESISVNGTAQTVTNKNVDLTIPDAANDATITIEVGGAASGATAPVAGDFSTNQDTAETITIPAAVSATQNTPAQPGVMSSADKEKLDSIAAFSSIQVTSGSTTGQVDAESATETLNLVAGDNITLTANDTTKTIEISASLGAELGFLSGSATVNGIVNNGDVLTDPLTGMVNSNNGRFIIDTDTDGHVYLYALKPDSVNGVDLFTISVNSNVSRTTANGFYGVAGLEIRHKDNGNSLITESTESYASQVGECSVDLTVTIKNSTGIPKPIGDFEYYGYLIRYVGDSTASGDAINVVTRISVIEETVGIVEYNGSQSSLSAGNGISIDNDTINANLGDGLGLDANNNIEVKVGAGLKIDTSGGVATVAIDNVTEEVVEEVQKLGEDLDKKITTTFPYAQITTMSDFMTYGTQGENRMFGQLFSVPITSELRVDDTVICVNALQSAPSIDAVFGIFEYDFSANNGAGSTYWLADTGVVHVSAGDNAFPIKNLINDVTRPSIELKSSCLYYAVWAIHNTGASNGLVLASCPGYGANYNAIPRYTVKTSGASVQVNWAGDGCLRNSWFSGYNEDNSIPRLFMMVRNKSDIQPSGNDPFIDITDYELNDQYTINQIFGSTAPSANGAVFQKVIPARAVNITKFEWADTKSTVTATSSSPMVMDNSFGTTLTLADGTLTTAQNGDYYVHTFTLNNALAMTAGTVYWLPAQYNTVTETGMSDGGDNKLVQYSTNVARRDLQMIVDMAQPSGSGEFKASQTGVYLKLYDDNNNSWVI
jgi:hypothetical protein